MRKESRERTAAAEIYVVDQRSSGECKERKECTHLSDSLHHSIQTKPNNKMHCLGENQFVME